MYTLEHKGFHGTVETAILDYKPMFFGHLKPPYDLAMYQSATLDGLNEAFVACVEGLIDDLGSKHGINV